MPSDRLIVVLLCAGFLVCLVGIGAALWWEEQRPSSYTRSPEYLASWRSRSASWQGSYDDVVLDAAEAAHEAALRAVDVDAEVAVAEAALVEAARRNAVFHP